MNVEDDIRRVQAFLKQKYGASTLNVPLEWTEGCVSWYRYSNPGAVNTQALLNFVTEQLFLADFQQIGLRSLPPNLQRTSVISLKSSYVLQLLFVVNIGQSAYTQHCKITKGLETNDDVSADKKIPAKWEPRGKRTLLLSLTDGIQTVDALEYVPIPALHLDLIPGTKVLLKGPVECRRGVILLRQPNVELLGGEVSDLVNCNAPENVLARLIGKPENPSPVYGNYSERVAATNEPEDEEYSQYTQHTQITQPSDGRQMQQIGLVHPATSNFGSPPGTSRSTWHLSVASSVAGREKRVLSSPAHPPPAKKAPPPVDMFPDDDDDVLFLADVAADCALGDGPDVRPGAPPPVSAPLPTSAPAERPFAYLARHLERRAASRAPPHRVPHLQEIVIKGTLNTVRSKLEVKRGKWRLVACVTDGSASLDVGISSEILEALIGYSPREMQSLTKSGGSSREIAERALDKAKQDLIRLTCLLRIRWPDDEQTDARPTLVRFEEITPRHLDVLHL